MSRFAHHASSRFANLGSGFVQARYIVVPALLWALAIGAVVAAAWLPDAPAGAPAQAASPEDVALVPLGA